MLKVWFSSEQFLCPIEFCCRRGLRSAALHQTLLVHWAQRSYKGAASLQQLPWNCFVQGVNNFVQIVHHIARLSYCLYNSANKPQIGFYCKGVANSLTSPFAHLAVSHHRPWALRRKLCQITKISAAEWASKDHASWGLDSLLPESLFQGLKQKSKQPALPGPQTMIAVFIRLSELLHQLTKKI